eukprot:CAMPEP_0202696596 /NCGR_PEP_ID=MMETSP1385-20130828/9887_1 /ASSEMBLY_ACC=CAM_ASM_000861 /TAXON_ID=933848 /ORGANISM="Elphidium margaritaceum" /LENGTH=732 /DNA_ID=CAMNT_0049352799 /DNA_START=33 /DNA_END=2231 /DNA_ORIENTATION=-
MSFDTNSFLDLVDENAAFDYLDYRVQESRKGWISTAASQIFFMQCGFLLYEVGFVHKTLVPAIIVKNITDLFISVATFLTIGWHITQHFYSDIFSSEHELLLINTPVHKHSIVFATLMYGSACSTIISGGVLERMQTKAYLVYCFFTMWLNYCMLVYWVWNPAGWLNQLGFVDAAGACVVHVSGGVASFVAVWFLGPRRGSVGHDGKLKPLTSASQPAIAAMGCFILWFGWHAFNISSPISGERQLGDVVGSIGLVTVLCPVSCAVSAAILMYRGYVKLTFDNFISSILAGLVSITGCASSVSPYSAFVIGFLAAPYYFFWAYIFREKLQLDDPVQVGPIHLMCGLYSCLMEGVLGNGTYGQSRAGLIHGGARHFGVQILGVLFVVTYDFIVSYIVFRWVMQRGLFRHQSIRHSILDTFLGRELFHLSFDWAFEDTLECEASLPKQILFLFHNHCQEQFADEQLDFLVAVTIFQDMLKMRDLEDKTMREQIAKHTIAMINTYCEPDGIMCINIESSIRERLLRFKNNLKMELIMEQSQHSRHTSYDDRLMIPTPQASKGKGSSTTLSVSRAPSKPSCPALSMLTEDVHIFQDAFGSVWRMMIPVFVTFLRKLNRKEKIKSYSVQLPFRLEEDWMLVWDKKLEKEHHHDNQRRLGAAAPVPRPHRKQTSEHGVSLLEPIPAATKDQQRKTPATRSLSQIVVKDEDRPNTPRTPASPGDKKKTIHQHAMSFVIT